MNSNNYSNGDIIWVGLDNVNDTISNITQNFDTITNLNDSALQNYKNLLDKYNSNLDSLRNFSDLLKTMYCKL